MIRALSQFGLNVPDDVSVVGFDGISIGESLIPNLATAVQPAEAMGNWAATHLVSRIEEGAPAQNVVLPHYIRQGESWSALAGVIESNDIGSDDSGVEETPDSDCHVN